MLLPYVVDFGLQLTRTVDGDLCQAGKLQKVAEETLFITVKRDIYSGPSLRLSADR